MDQQAQGRLTSEQRIEAALKRAQARAVAQSERTHLPVSTLLPHYTAQALRQVIADMESDLLRQDELLTITHAPGLTYIEVQSSRLDLFLTLGYAVEPAQDDYPEYARMVEVWAGGQRIDGLLTLEHSDWLSKELDGAIEQSRRDSEVQA